MAIDNRTHSSDVNTVMSLLSVTGYGCLIRLSRVNGGWVRFCIHLAGPGVNGRAHQRRATRPPAGKHDITLFFRPQGYGLLEYRTRRSTRTADRVQLTNTPYEVRSTILTYVKLRIPEITTSCQRQLATDVSKEHILGTL